VRRLLRLFAAAAFVAPSLAAQAPPKGTAPKAPADPKVSVDPKASTAPAPPASVKAELTAVNRITVTWSPVAGAESYILGRSTANSGFRRLQVPDARATTFEDFDVAPGQRYMYQVAAVRAGVAGARTQSEWVDAAKSGATVVGGSSPAAGGGTGGSRPVGKRYRVSVIGLWAARQTYDNPLQIDGKGDEVYLAAHVAHVDTTRDDVVEHAVLRTEVMGDVNGYRDRIRLGSANGEGGAGGIVSGDRIPDRTLSSAGAKRNASGFPFVLFEGELIPGASFLAITPTIWEWDANAELLERWVVSRELRIAELVRPEMLALSLSSKHYGPMEVAAPALSVRTNMFGDARDRPIGMELGAPTSATAADLFAASASSYLGAAGTAPAGTGASTAGAYGAIGGSSRAAVLSGVLSAISRMIGVVVGRISPIAERILAQASRFTGRIPGLDLPDPQWAKTRMGGDVKNAVRLEPPDKAYVAARLDSLRANPSLPRSGINVIVPRALAAARRATGARDAFFFEKMLVLTPTAIDYLFQSYPGSMSRPPAVIEVHYADNEALKGRYTLYLQVERLR
jgi:hypothetical protein